MNDAPNPQEEADRIRSKRLAKLSSAPRTPTPAAEPSTTPTPKPKPATPKPAPTPAQAPSPSSSVRPSTPSKKPQATPAKLDVVNWEHETVGSVLRVTLDRDYAERHGWEPVWLKHLQEELESENPEAPRPLRLNIGMADRLLISRLEVDPEGASEEDLEYMAVLASLPAGQTVFEYLVGCWKRHNTARAMLLKRNYAPQDLQQALGLLDKLKDLIISYAGLTLQEPEMFKQPPGKPIGPPELVASLLSLSTLSGPLVSSAPSDSALSDSEVPQFLADLAQRFEPDDELIDVLGPVVRQLCFHESLQRPGSVGGADSGWRGVVAGLEVLVSVKAIAVMIPKLPEWNPAHASAPTFERVSLMGPLMRLSVFDREWPAITQTYFSNPEKRSRADVDSSNASLRGTLKSLQSSLFQIFNAFVRVSPESREAVLQYFSRVVSLNVKRRGMQVEFDTVASDGFLVNLQTLLLRFAEPFMDATYSKIDRIDPLYLARSNRVDVTEETRLKATSEEAAEWVKEVQASGGPSPNFISEIFYLTAAMNHYGLMGTIQTYDDFQKQADEIQRHLDTLQGDTSWQGTPNQPRVEAAIEATKNELAKVHAQQFAAQVQILDPEYVFRQIGFINFFETWILRLVDPKHTHPKPTLSIPLPQEIPKVFRMLPEYFLEDVVEYLLFLMRNTPQSFDLSGRNELVIWALTFLRSTWYIKNPFLKAKINEVIFFGTLAYGREQNGVLGNILNTHPVALKHLMPAMMSFYCEVEQTGASSQFYDKFNARRNIAYILKAIWNNPTHREALNNEAHNVEKFVRFVNLMMNDVTYLLDESLSELTQIHDIQQEMANQAVWNTKPQQYRREREGTLRQLERHASGYITLGRSTVNLLKIFTAETKRPFMMPEIVDRLAAMLNYNLDALVGPRTENLKVKDKEKYRFDPRALLSDIFQVYLNLSDQGEFVRAVAGEGRSYKKELFERAAGHARRHHMKTEDEIEKLRLFVVKVEEMKATMEAEDDLGDAPDEFLDPLMFSLMRDPVILPSSRTVIDRSTIKAHLLSDTKDPFNRVPLTLDEVIPNVELKAKIDAFLAQRANKNTALDVPEEQIVNMDVDTGGTMELDG
ncbi:hypothetical protein BD410DRAFT_747294 [Rickenella mellea]|uniref:RING-type E3 ubiquitin transferase n=1 Tax=Rickenella mellea TaxID=50990 RepID=A0A4Y7Q725_9AGAM|nr:hypothetical protein BD410DRAFT_747294 [Rickenella mellea]